MWLVDGKIRFHKSWILLATLHNNLIALRFHLILKIKAPHLDLGPFAVWSLSDGCVTTLFRSLQELFLLPHWGLLEQQWNNYITNTNDCGLTAAQLSRLMMSRSSFSNDHCVSLHEFTWVYSISCVHKQALANQNICLEQRTWILETRQIGQMGNFFRIWGSVSCGKLSGLKVFRLMLNLNVWECIPIWD